jgi:transposase
MNEFRHQLENFDFEKLYKNEQDPNARIRLLGIQLLKEGKSPGEIANVLKKNKRTVLNWVRRFKSEGLNGLFDKPGRGRKSKLAKEDEKEFLSALDELKNNKNKDRVTGEDIRILLKEKFNAEYSLNSVYDLLERLGATWLAGRSQTARSKGARRFLRQGQLVKQEANVAVIADKSSSYSDYPKPNL